MTLENLENKKLKLVEVLKNHDIPGEELARIASDSVNFMGNHREVLDEIVADTEAMETFTGISIAFILSLATMGADDRFYDGRNEQACKTAHRLAQYDGFKALSAMTGWDGSIPHTLSSLKLWEHTNGRKPGLYGEFAFNMVLQHRTLQQSFAELAFTVADAIMKENGDDGAAKYMEGYGFYDWTRMMSI